MHATGQDRRFLNEQVVDGAPSGIPHLVPVEVRLPPAPAAVLDTARDDQARLLAEVRQPLISATQNRILLRLRETIHTILFSARHNRVVKLDAQDGLARRLDAHALQRIDQPEEGDAYTPGGIAALGSRIFPYQREEVAVLVAIGHHRIGRIGAVGEVGHSQDFAVRAQRRMLGGSSFQK
jgi:hypothetical protein